MHPARTARPLCEMAWSPTPTAALRRNCAFSCSCSSMAEVHADDVLGIPVVSLSASAPTPLPLLRRAPRRPFPPLPPPGSPLPLPLPLCAISEVLTSSSPPVATLAAPEPEPALASAPPGPLAPAAAPRVPFPPPSLPPLPPPLARPFPVPLPLPSSALPPSTRFAALGSLSSRGVFSRPRGALSAPFPPFAVLDSLPESSPSETAASAGTLAGAAADIGGMIRAPHASSEAKVASLAVSFSFCALVDETKLRTASSTSSILRLSRRERGGAFFP